MFKIFTSGGAYASRWEIVTHLQHKFEINFSSIFFRKFTSIQRILYLQNPYKRDILSIEILPNFVHPFRFIQRQREPPVDQATTGGFFIGPGHGSKKLLAGFCASRPTPTMGRGAEGNEYDQRKAVGIGGNKKGADVLFQDIPLCRFLL